MLTLHSRAPSTLLSASRPRDGWVAGALANLAARQAWGYSPQGNGGASEPAAIAALALAVWGEDPRRPADWLLEHQSGSGAVGVLGGDGQPGWTTSWAILAWRGAVHTVGESTEQGARWLRAATKGLDWLTQAKGEIVEQHNTAKHDATLVGWSWVEGTHTWCEPTALAVLAFRAMGKGAHPRAKEGTAVLIDRLLPAGGANYGNTMVLGQWLRPHVQPTGLVLWALGHQASSDASVKSAVDYLTREAAREEAAASLSYAALGLASQGRTPGYLPERIAARGSLRSAEKESAYTLGLLLLAYAAATSGHVFTELVAAQG